LWRLGAVEEKHKKKQRTDTAYVPMCVCGESWG
jgi:hypothetical protein